MSTMDTATSIVTKNNDNDKKQTLDELLSIYYSKTRVFQGDVTLVPYIKDWLRKRNLDQTYIFKLMLTDENSSVYSSLLGFFYHYGIGTKVDKNSALEWYQIGAEQGIFISEYQAAFFYIEDNRLDEAFRLYQKSANNGSDIAQLALGWCYEFGHGCPRDTTKALEQFREVALRGNCGGMYYYAIALSDGIDGQVNVREAEFWFKKAAEAGHWDAQNTIAEIYWYKKHDLLRAYYWFLKSAENSCPCALRNLARFEFCERQDTHAAIRWYRRAIRHGHMTNLLDFLNG
ncbi:14588_t:CDS:1 [Ambispora leptoticha]|uniref:14588_t:CDS:1 n=1 Tax=Ambispora leptoticha TaxID=144679 RepID=A0A9N9AGA1_9GLOM|nr:14588_t:CDS:1 [Ambispora leptoticha]